MECKVDDKNYILVQGWMINELNLKGNELIIYAIIYGFSQTDGQTFKGGLQYLADWTNSTKQGVIKNLKSLEDKGLIVKKEQTINNVKFCEYHSTKFNTVNESSINNINKENNNINIINNTNILLKETEKADKPLRNHYGKYGRVLLTAIEYNRLVTEFGQAKIDKQIELLDEYIESNNNKNKYTNFNLVLRKSIRDNWFNTNKPTTKNYDDLSAYDNLI